MISQREARRLKRRVDELERAENARYSAWADTYPFGVHIATVPVDAPAMAAIMTARKLGHAVVLSRSSETHVLCHALPIAKPYKGLPRP